MLFSRMEDNPLLQFSDLVLGLTRELVDFSLGKKPADSFGVQLGAQLIPKFRGFPGRIAGRGISVAPSNGDLSGRIMRALFELRKGA